MFSVASSAAHSYQPKSYLKRELISSNLEYYLLITSVIIAVIGLILSGCLFSKIGSSSLAFGGIGLCIGFVLLVFSKKVHIIKNKTQLNFETIKELSLKGKNGNTCKDVDSSEMPEESENSVTVEYLSKKDCNITGRVWLHGLRHFPPYLADLSLRSEYYFQKLYFLEKQDSIVSTAEGVSISPNSLKKKLLDKLPMVNGNFGIPFFWHVANNHWALVYIDLQDRTIEFYDSKVDHGNHEEILSILKDICEAVSNLDPHKPHYRLIEKINKVLQPDGYQCGPWVLYFLENRLKNPKVDFNLLNIEDSQRMIAEFRIQIMERLQTICAIRNKQEFQEERAYIEFYKDKTIGGQAYYNDQLSIPLTDRWKLLLTGHFLSPHQNI